MIVCFGRTKTKLKKNTLFWNDFLPVRTQTVFRFAKANNNCAGQLQRITLQLFLYEIAGVYEVTHRWCFWQMIPYMLGINTGALMIAMIGFDRLMAFQISNR